MAIPADASITMALPSAGKPLIVVQHRRMVARGDRTAYVGGTASADLQQFVAKSSLCLMQFLSLQFVADCVGHGLGKGYPAQVGQFGGHLTSGVVLKCSAPNATFVELS